MPKDLTEKQFKAKLSQYGFNLKPFGYCDIGNNVEVYRFDGGERLRSQLAYLIKEHKRLMGG